MTGLKLDQHVHVTRRSEVIPKDRPEEREPAHVVAATEGRHRVPVNLEPREHGP